MAYDPETRPGRWVAAQARRRERRVWLGIAGFFVVAILMLVPALGHRLGFGAFGSVLFLAFVIAAKPHADRYVDEAVRWIRGARAEEAVGATLNELRREGWVVMHDLERPGEGNIDHLVSGPSGVFMIETKACRYEEPHLVKAKRQAPRVHDELGVWVTPVICLHQRDGDPFRTRGVWIVPRERLPDWLRRQRNRSVPFDRIAQFAERLVGS